MAPVNIALEVIIYVLSVYDKISLSKQYQIVKFLLYNTTFKKITFYISSNNSHLEITGSYNYRVLYPCCGRFYIEMYRVGKKII